MAFEQMALDLPPVRHLRKVVYCEDCEHGKSQPDVEGEVGKVLCTKGGAHLKRRGFLCADGELAERGT